MFKILILSVFALWCLITPGYSELSVIEPKSLKDVWKTLPNPITSLATFGLIPWGKKIVGNLRLTNPLDACDYIKLSQQEYLEHSILVAMRGNCTFVTKAHYAQLAGANMLLILNDKYEDVEMHLMVDNTDEGKNIKIPVALVSKVPGEKLLNSLQSKDKAISTISVKFDFSITKAKTIEYHVWLSSSKNQTFTFVKEWKANADRLEKYAKLVPHFFHEKTSDNMANCVCGGKYCAADPDGERSNTGRDVLIEDLRQICLIKLYSMEHWYTYMNNYQFLCFTGADMGKCGTAMLRSVEADKDKIKECIEKSFDVNDFDKCSSNKYLEAEKDLMKRDKVYLFPSVTINGFTARGSLLPVRNLLLSICEFLIDLPPVCQEALNITPPRHSSFWTLFTIGFLILSLTIVVIVFMRRSMKREMQEKVQKDVAIMIQQYSALTEAKVDNLDQTL